MVAALFEVFLGATGAVGGLLRFIGELHSSASTLINLVEVLFTLSACVKLISLFDITHTKANVSVSES